MQVILRDEPTLWPHIQVCYATRGSTGCSANPPPRIPDPNTIQSSRSVPYNFERSINLCCRGPSTSPSLALPLEIASFPLLFSSCIALLPSALPGLAWPDAECDGCKLLITSHELHLTSLIRPELDLT
mmetsp:Transcript_38998/g.63181  ORF Transcript_38998/g.63181 Transcript_38998/m.63181 type:complete len:128 (+) Transcript_38998:89-472(+)